MTLLEFLENARFPNPPIQTQRGGNTADVSSVDMGLVDEAWKAQRALKDPYLATHLCQTLRQILGRTPLPEDSHRLAQYFSPELDHDYVWEAPNMTGARATTLLTSGVNRALAYCARIYDPDLTVLCDPESRYGQSLSRVDWAIVVHHEDRILLEAKSPTVMRAVGEKLPQVGAHLTWREGSNFMSKIFLKIAVYLGLRQKEWLFLTCHNSWVVFRLVDINGDRVLVYSPVLEIANSSIPFCAYLGALLSVVKNVPVQQTILSPDLVLDTLREEPEEDNDESHDDNSSDEYRPPGGGSVDGNGTTASPMTRSRHRAMGGNGDAELMLTSSSADSSDPYWVHLNRLSSDYFAFPSFRDEWGSRVRITRLLGMGSTGGVYVGLLGEKLLAVKVVEILGQADVVKRQRLRSEFDAYARLEQAYDSGKLVQRVAPHCYGAFGGKRLDALVMDLHGDALSDWDELVLSERNQVFVLVKQLHLAGILHCDLEPRNVVRMAGGDFLLIDFANSVSHICPDNDQLNDLELHRPPPRKRVKCFEISHIRKELRKLQPLIPSGQLPTTGNGHESKSFSTHRVNA